MKRRSEPLGTLLLAKSLGLTTAEAAQLRADVAAVRQELGVVGTLRMVACREQRKRSSDAPPPEEATPVAKFKATPWAGLAEDGSVGFDCEHGEKRALVTFAADGEVEIVIRNPGDKAPNEDINRLRGALGFSQSASDTTVVNEAISRLVLTR